MNKRTERVISVMTAFALVVFTTAVVLGATGFMEQATNCAVSACFAMLWSIYLEVYSNRG